MILRNADESPTKSVYGTQTVILLYNTWRVHFSLHARQLSIQVTCRWSLLLGDPLRAPLGPLEDFIFFGHSAD